MHTATMDAGLLASIPTDTARTARTGMLLLAVGFGGFLTWSAVAELASGAVAPGIVAVSSSRKTIDHLEGGIVREIAVKDGDMVKAGQLLVRLDDVDAKAQVDILTALYAAARAETDRLRAERDGASTVVMSDALLGQSETGSVDAATANQRTIREARAGARDARVTVLNKRIGQLKEQYVAYEAQLAGQEKLLSLLDVELATVRTAFSKGHVTRTRLFSLETEAARAIAERDALKASLMRSREEVAETEAQILQVNADFQDNVATKLGEAEDKVANLRERLTSARDRLARTAIKAPVPGKVVGLRVHTHGSSVRPSEPVLEIVPSEDRLVIEAQLSPADIERVGTGQKAEVRFITLARTVPGLEGIVEAVSADRLMDAEQRYAFYLLKVSVDDSELDKLGDTAPLPGMPVEVMVKTGERTVLGYLMDPLINAMGRTFREE